MSESPKLISQRFTPNFPARLEPTEPDQTKATRDPEETLIDSEKNARFKALKKKRENKKCCNCNAKFPQWASASFGILICMNCSGKHRFLGPNISFVRSVAMDKWKEREMRTMEIGGNKRFLEYLETEMISGEIDYDSSALRRYKSQLAKEVSAQFQTPKTDAILPREPLKEKQLPKEEKPEQEKPFEPEEEKQVKPLEEQKTKVVMAKPKEAESENGGNKRGRRRGKNKRFAGKRVAKVDLDQLVKDDLKVKAKATIKKKGMFEMGNEAKNAEKEAKEAREEEPKNTGQIKKQANNFLSSKDIQEKIQKSKLNKFSGFGSDNLMDTNSAQTSDQMKNMSSDVFGGYGSDDLNHKSRANVSSTRNGEQASKWAVL